VVSGDNITKAMSENSKTLTGTFHCLTSSSTSSSGYKQSSPSHAQTKLCHLKVNLALTVP